MRSDPTGRALHLLSLLQSHQFWPGAELARRLEVTQRTVRRDVERLRDLGYPVAATSGVYGGYRLESGSHMPPLVLDDDEAVAVAVGLRLAAGAAIGGMDQTSLRAMTTIEQLLPHRLRRRVAAMHANVSSPPWPAQAAVVDAGALSMLAGACRDLENVRFDYRTDDGTGSSRHVEPHGLVTSGRRWYLVAWDHDRESWRTFRLDRIDGPRSVGSHFDPRDVPDGAASAFVESTLGVPRDHTATLRIQASSTDLKHVLRWVDHTEIESEAHSCLVEIRSEDVGRLTMAVARIAIAAPVTVVEPRELVDAVAQLTAHLGGTST